MDVEARESASVSYPASLEVSPTGSVSGSMVSATNVVGLPPALGDVDVAFGGDLGEDPLGDTSLAGLAAGEGVSSAIIGT